MANNNFTPDQPQYYNRPETFPNITNLLSTNTIPDNQEEREVFRASLENLQAFLQSRILYNIESPELMEQILSRIPGYNPEDPRRNERRQLSAEAREQFLNLAMDFHYTDDGVSVPDRTYNLLLSRGRTQEDQEYNERIYEILDNGTPEDKGALFEQRMDEVLPMLKKILNGISDREMIENFKEFQKCQDLVFCAQNIRLLADADNAPIILTPRARAIGKFMEENSVLVDYIFQRVNVIANPIYEHMDLDAVLEMNNDDFSNLLDQVDTNRNPDVYHFLWSAFNVRQSAMNVREINKKQLDESMKMVEKANEGFFIGSRAYSQAMRSMENLTKFRRTIGDPPSAAEVARLTPMLRETMAKCQTYLNTKDPQNFKNEREEIRFKAMQHALESCEMDLNFFEAQAKAVKSEKLNFYRPNPDEAYPAVNPQEVRWKAQETYGTYAYENMLGQYITVNGEIPASNVGNIAEELRANTYKNLLNVMFTEDEFSAGYARNVMANMVALEMVKNGRSKNEQGQIIAGPVEEELAKDPGAVIDNILNNRYFQAMTPDITPEMLGNFVMSNGAKNIVNHMERVAQQGGEAVNNHEPVIQNQNEMAPQVH